MALIRCRWEWNDMITEISDMITVVKNKKPLVLHMTNYVTACDCANVTLCVGGLPIMASEVEDAMDMVKIASALILNIGTPDSELVDSMIKVGKLANDLNIPIVLDPVGIRKGSYRMKLVDDILSDVKISVIKGNGGEISVMTDMNGEVVGVDTVRGPSDNIFAVKKLAKTTGAVVAMTGETDYVSDGTRVYILSNGNPVMGRIVGTGCMTSSVVGCYIGALGVSVDTVSAALSIFSIAGEMAINNSSGPGMFKSALMDSLNNLTIFDVETHIRVRRL
ncbi:MAG: hydroxyethylthiazole kinase [archaeon]|nr:hydroxyethylthiazole kinase [archaeon]